MPGAACPSRETAGLPFRACLPPVLARRLVKPFTREQPPTPAPQPAKVAPVAFAQRALVEAALAPRSPQDPFPTTASPREACTAQHPSAGLHACLRSPTTLNTLRLTRSPVATTKPTDTQQHPVADGHSTAVP